MSLNEIKIAVKLLPISAAPFLSFSFEDVDRIRSVYKGLSKRLENFVYIGSDGEGSPICVNQKNGSVYILDHELDFLPGYMNDSIHELVQFIKLYENHIQNIRENYGDDAYLDGKYPEFEIDNLRKKFSGLNSKATFEPAFWDTVLEVEKSMLTE